MIILGIVASLGTVSFTGWVRKHDLESQVKEMYTDLMNARLTAMHQNRARFITLSANQLRAYEDNDPAPSGDGMLTSDQTILSACGNANVMTRQMQAVQAMPHCLSRI